MDQFDDLWRLRAARAAFRPSGPGPTSGDSPGFVGQVTTASPAVGKFCLVKPVTLTGTESENLVGTFGVADPAARVAVYLLGPAAPATGDYLICKHVNYRWVAERGTGSGGGTIVICGSCNIPTTLTLTWVYSDVPQNGFFNGDPALCPNNVPAANITVTTTLTWVPGSGWLSPWIAIGSGRVWNCGNFQVVPNTFAYPGNYFRFLAKIVVSGGACSLYLAVAVGANNPAVTPTAAAADQFGVADGNGPDGINGMSSTAQAILSCSPFHWSFNPGPNPGGYVDSYDITG